MLVLLFWLAALLPSSQADAATIKPVRWVTKSGMVVLFIERHSLPIVHLQLLVKAGSVFDPTGQEGTANMVADLLDEGTPTRTSQQLAEAVDFLGASLSASAGEEFTAVSLSVLKKDAAAGMELFSDALLHPTFPEKEIERVRQQILGGLVAEEDEPEAVADKAWQELVYGTHPYHHPVEGYPASLPAITRKQLVEFHQRYYQPRQAILAVVGDLKRAEVERLIAHYLGEWKNAPGDAPPPVIESPTPPQPQVKLIDKELTQATILMGHLGVARSNPDYYAISVMNYILGGGGFSSRLLKQIRDNQGLVYGARSAFSPMKSGGSFEISLQTKNATANQAIDETLKLVRQFQAEGATQQELDEAKAYLIGSFPLRLDTDAKLVGLLPILEFYNLGLDYFDTYPDKIRAVTLDDIKRTATTYLHPDRMVLVVVAKQSAAKIAAPPAPAPPPASPPASR